MTDGTRNRRGWPCAMYWGVMPVLLAGLVCAVQAGAADDWTLIGWNNLGMHCMDARYDVFSLLPPFNTIQAQLVDGQGQLVRDSSGITVTYEAVTDPDGSINSTSIGKTDFWEHVEELFGLMLPLDTGLFESRMPGSTNEPQLMQFDSTTASFLAEGIPITPYDDALRKNPYPLMRLVARDESETILATTDIVLPVSDEMDCKACHASDTSPAARPRDDWVRDPNPDRDMRLNVLLLHDDREVGKPAFAEALQRAGYNAAGLYATATESGISILCARCHASEALPGSGYEGIESLTQAIHRRMAFVLDPTNNLLLDSVDNRSACYRCHPGSVTRCLRGAMGAAVAADGSLAIQCQSCHGRMTAVAAPERMGWLDEPACQSCHTGTALANAGSIRYTSVFDDGGEPRAAPDATFATNADTPAEGLSLYQFSIGHGGLYCPACHGSTHAEFPSSHRNDNLQSVGIQGHVGVLSECTACHPSVPRTVSGGPHGMHPVGESWVEQHGDVAEEGGASACRVCHGADYRGTVLSRAQAERTLETDFGVKHFWRGFRVSCYGCHLGPNNEHANPNHPAVVDDGSASTTAGTPVDITLNATDADGDSLTLRIVSQGANGTVGLQGTTATYSPQEGFTGADSFTFAAWDGSTDSNLGRIDVTVEEALACAGDCDGNGVVQIDELILGVRIALGEDPPAACPAFDLNEDQQVSVDELIQAVLVALDGCTGAG